MNKQEREILEKAQALEDQSRDYMRRANMLRDVVLKSRGWTIEGEDFISIYSKGDHLLFDDPDEALSIEGLEL